MRRINEDEPLHGPDSRSVVSVVAVRWMPLPCCTRTDKSDEARKEGSSIRQKEALVAHLHPDQGVRIKTINRYNSRPRFTLFFTNRDETVQVILIRPTTIYTDTFQGQMILDLDTYFENYFNTCCKLIPCAIEIADHTCIV